MIDLTKIQKTEDPVTTGESMERLLLLLYNDIGCLYVNYVAGDQDNMTYAVTGTIIHMLAIGESLGIDVEEAIKKRLMKEELNGRDDN